MKLSDTWLRAFKRRYGWHYEKVRGEGASADLAKAESAREKLPKIISEIVASIEDVYNADETAIQYQKAPSKRIASGLHKAKGEKAAKSRITFTLCSNATGSVRLPLQAIVPMPP